MKLTQTQWEQFLGGQLEIRNDREGYIYRGEIERIAVDAENSLNVKFAWLAEGEGFPPTPMQWVKSDRSDYSFDLDVYAVEDIGLQEGRHWIRLSCWMNGESATFFPFDEGEFDRSEVVGLDPIRLQ